MINELYNRQILNQAAQISHVGRLQNPQASAFKQAKYFGSTITVDLNLQDGVVTDFAQEIQACALGQAAASIIASKIIGTSAAELRQVHQTLKRMLQQDAAPPQGRFEAFAMLQPAKDYKARHGSILLVLEAIVACLNQIEDEENK